MKSRSLLPVLLLLAAACGTHETAPNEPDPTEATSAAAPVETPKPAEFVAVVSSKTSKVVTADFQGRIVRMFVHAGQTVHAGDPIADLDASELESKLAESVGARSSAGAEASRASVAASTASRKARLEQRLMRSGASAPEGYRSAMDNVRSASAEGGVAYGRLKELGATIDQLKKLIASAHVVAPMDGIVSVVKLKEGEVPQKGTAIAKIFDPRDLVIRFAVPREQLATVKLGSALDVRVDGATVPATVVRFDEQHDPTINFTVFEAEIIETQTEGKLRSDEIRVGSKGHVRIAVKGVVR